MLFYEAQTSKNSDFFMIVEECGQNIKIGGSALFTSSHVEIDAAVLFSVEVFFAFL